MSDAILGKVEAEDIIEKYLDFVNKEKFKFSIECPIFTDIEKIKLINLRTELWKNVEIPFEDIYQGVSPDQLVTKCIKLVVIRNQTMELDNCWSISYQTDLYLETENPCYSIFGYGKFLIDKATKEVFITPSSYDDKFWDRDYGNCKSNLPREYEMGWTWNPLNTKETVLDFLVSGPIVFYKV